METTQVQPTYMLTEIKKMFIEWHNYRFPEKGKILTNAEMNAVAECNFNKMMEICDERMKVTVRA